MSSIKTAGASTQDIQIIKTTRFGDLKINQDKVITMVSPFLGFPEESSFILVPHSEKSPFWWLQSAKNGALAFVVIQPSIVNPQYKPTISKQHLHDLQVKKEQELDLLLILTIPEAKPQEMTANLLGPIAFNSHKKLAKQLLLDPARYSPCWPVPLEEK